MGRLLRASPLKQRRRAVPDHLAAALAMPGWQADYGLPDTAVHAALPISGLFELAPIAASHVQEWMALTEPELHALSPLRHIPGTAPSVIAVAEHETPGFHRQSEAYALALAAPLLTIPGRNHFDVILDLMQPDSILSKALLSLIGPVTATNPQKNPDTP